MRKFQDFCFGSFISGSRICAGCLRIAAGARRSFVRIVHERDQQRRCLVGFADFPLLVGWNCQGGFALEILLA